MMKNLYHVVIFEDHRPDHSGFGQRLSVTSSSTPKMGKAGSFKPNVWFELTPDNTDHVDR